MRIKRKKTTVFLHCEPTDAIHSLKDQLHTLLDQVRGTAARMRDHQAAQEPDKQRLLLLSSNTVLEDSKTLADAGVANDDALALVYLNSGVVANSCGSSTPPPPCPQTVCGRTSTSRHPPSTRRETRLYVVTQHTHVFVHSTEEDVGAATGGRQHTRAGLVGDKVAHVLAVGARVIVVGLASVVSNGDLR